MHILVIILLVIAGLLVLLLLIAALSKKELTVTRSIVINRPQPVVFDFVRHIRNQEKYSVWVMRDPHVKLTYTGTDGTLGFIASWESNNRNVGVGAQEIKKITEDSIQMELRFKKPFEATNEAIAKAKAIGDSQTQLSNSFYGKSKFPMNIMNGMIAKMLGKDMQQNLENAKKILEA